MHTYSCWYEHGVELMSIQVDFIEDVAEGCERVFSTFLFLQKKPCGLHLL